MLTEQELALAKILVEALDLEDIAPEDIAPDAPLFGFDQPDSLGLDSIDALEISLAISQNYNVQLKADDENSRAAFSNIRSLVKFITENT